MKVHRSVMGIVLAVIGIANIAYSVTQDFRNQGPIASRPDPIGTTSVVSQPSPPKPISPPKP